MRPQGKGSDTWDVAVVGATGLVGRTMLRVLAERRFPVGRLMLFASERSAGQTIEFRGRREVVRALDEDSLRSSGAQIALFSAGASVSRIFAPIASSAGMLVVDNSSAFRMDVEIPLVVPEVNGHRIPGSSGIIANPNCSTIQMVVAIKPLHDRWKIRRVVVATYQSVTGAGARGSEQLREELEGRSPVQRKFAHTIAGNLIPQIDEVLEDGSTKEEEKMVRETAKIMEDADLRVAATCVRVPVTGGHSEAVNIECERPFNIEEVREVLRSAPGVVVLDEPDKGVYPMPVMAEGRDEVFVGRIRRDSSVPNGLSLWIVSDNLRKGAATNAVQIAEMWVKGRNLQPRRA